MTGPTTSQPKLRYTMLDTLRGLTMLSMILYHFLWDLVYLAGIHIPWYNETGAYIWQQSICRTFILLSGFCWSFGRTPLKRGLIVFWGGGLITLVTMLLMPENRVLFGVLTLLGSSMILMIPLDRMLRRIKHPALTILLTALFIVAFELCRGINYKSIPGIRLPDRLYSNLFTAYLGFPPAGFYSTDYFPLLPWFLLFVAGYLIHKCCTELHLLRFDFLRKDYLAPVTFMGRHALIIYMIHQPILYVVTLLVMLLRQ